MRRRAFLTGAAALAAAPRAGGQGVRRIGFVVPTGPDARRDAFLRGLRALGYVEGHNIHVETRFAEGRPERLPGLIDEVIRSNIDVLVVGATIGARAAKKATSTIPIVFAGSSDPVAGGVVTNLARPEGNITGLSFAASDGFAGKWLELLKEAVPPLARVGALWSSSNAAAARFPRELQAAARTFGVRLDAYHASKAAQLDDALAALGASDAQGLIVTPSPFAASQRGKLVAFAAAKRLPAMYFVDSFVDAGGLMSYGPSITDTYLRAASYVDKLLKGARPADPPVEQSAMFDLAINLGAARDLGLAIPHALLLRATRVIGGTN